MGTAPNLGLPAGVPSGLIGTQISGYRIDRRGRLCDREVFLGGPRPRPSPDPRQVTFLQAGFQQIKIELQLIGRRQGRRAVEYPRP